MYQIIKQENLEKNDNGLGWWDKTTQLIVPRKIKSQL